FSGQPPTPAAHDGTAEQLDPQARTSDQAQRPMLGKLRPFVPLIGETSMKVVGERGHVPAEDRWNATLMRPPQVLQHPLRQRHLHGWRNADMTVFRMVSRQRQRRGHVVKAMPREK